MTAELAPLHLFFFVGGMLTYIYIHIFNLYMFITRMHFLYILTCGYRYTYKNDYMYSYIDIYNYISPNVLYRGFFLLTIHTHIRIYLNEFIHQQHAVYIHTYTYTQTYCAVTKCLHVYCNMPTAETTRKASETRLFPMVAKKICMYIHTHTNIYKCI